MASLHTDLRNILAQAVIDFVDDAALLRLYTTGATTLLSEHECGTPFAPAPVAGVISLNAIADGVGLADGDAAMARLYQSDGTTIVINNMTVTDSTGDGDIKLDQVGTTISEAQPVVVNTRTVTVGNA